MGGAADLRPLAAVGVWSIEIDLRGVQRINSSGVRTWIDSVRAVPAPPRILAACTAACVPVTPAVQI